MAEAVDPDLPGGGLALGALHEFSALSIGPCFGLLCLLAGRAGRTTVWIEQKPSIWPAGALQFGLRHENLLLVDAHGTEALWAAEECLRHSAIGAVCVVDAKLDLTAGRRLHLAAESGGTACLCIVPEASMANPSAARTRWRVDAAPGTGTAEYDLGDPVWRIDLVTAKGGRPGSWRLRWDRDTRCLMPHGEERVPHVVPQAARSGRRR